MFDTKLMTDMSYAVLESFVFPPALYNPWEQKPKENIQDKESTRYSKKDQVYVPPLPAGIPKLKVPKLKVRIRTAIETITADMLRTVWNELDYRVDVCRLTKGANIQHL